jgi:pimeloyl-ACP methyl ester carboxylesterase
MTLTLVDGGSAVKKYRFEVPVHGEPVPGLLWTARAGAWSEVTVLLGHGRTADKRIPALSALAHRLAHRGWNAVAIDAPGHGERRAPESGQDWPRPDAEQASEEWHAVIDFLHEKAGLGSDQLGYWGVSMGTSLGMSLLAGEPRVRAAVLGLMHADWPAPPGNRIRADAASVTCPVLFLVNWDDQRAPRRRVFELYDLIGSADKRLHAYPGDHGQLPDEAMTASEEFLARYLAAHQG